MEEKRGKVKINGYVDGEVWKRFLRTIFEKHGRTSGGAISLTIEDALRTYLESESK